MTGGQKESYMTTLTKLQEFYEVVRDGKKVSVRRKDLAITERHQISARLRKDAKADLARAERLEKTPVATSNPSGDEGFS
jgi:hypothetical protein